MIESLRTTQIAFFRFVTPCGFFRGSGDEVQKVSVQGFVHEKIQWNHLWEHRFSLSDPRVFPPPDDGFSPQTTENRMPGSLVTNTSFSEQYRGDFWFSESFRDEKMKPSIHSKESWITKSFCCFFKENNPNKASVPVVQRLNSAIHRINHYPAHRYGRN